MASRYKFLINRKIKRRPIDTRPDCYGYHDGDVFFYYTTKGKKKYATLIRRKNDWWIGGRTDGTALLNDRARYDERNYFEQRYIPIRKNIWFHKIWSRILWNERGHHFAENPSARP
jgi:hypothetical protein